MGDGITRGITARLVQSLPRETPGSAQELRLDRYGDVYNIPSTLQGSALGGKYFTGVNPTLSTAIATTTSITAFTVASPVALFYNQGSVDIVLDQFTMNIVQVPTSATSWQFAWTYDTVDRYTSGGTLVVPKNVNGNVGNESAMRFHFGAIVATSASANVRNHSRGGLRGVIPTTFDEMGFVFGEKGSTGSFASAAASAKYINGVPGCVIAPGHSMILYMWGAANAGAPSWEFTAGWLEI